MKLRYYMRGLGIGILVTAIVMSISLHGRIKPMTDEEVIERAKELGMEEAVGGGVLADAISENSSVTESDKTQGDKPATETDGEQVQQSDSEDSDTQPEKPDEEAAAEGKQADTETEAGDTRSHKPDYENDSSQTSESESEAASPTTETENEQATVDREKKAEETASTSEDAKQIEITVNSGDGSLTVAKKLEQAGLIEDAKAFDRYLCQNGYDKKICTGTHSFEEGASDEDIAKELTSKAKNR